MVINLSLNDIYLHLLSIIFLILFAYFLTISILEKLHHCRSGLVLIFGVIIITTISHLINYDELFILRIIGTLSSMLLISITYIDSIKRWFKSDG